MNNKKLQDLTRNFHPDKIVPFINEKNNAISRARESLSRFDDEDFKDGVKLGEIPFSQNESMIICAFKVKKTLSERSGKKAQFNKAIKILDIFEKDSSIFVFYDHNGNFRISLIYLIYKGKKREKSNFQRFTYYVSPELTNKTFLQQVDGCDFSSLNAIQEAFSVEKVTNQFFAEFRSIFDRTKEEFESANKNTICLWLKSKYEKADYEEQVNKFIFTFLGRIIFLYFLLRKGWIEDKSDYVRNIFEDKTKHNLYLDVLVPLFFDVFAKQEHERPAEIRVQYKNTPYLNGGLFEHSDLEAEMAKSGKFILFRDDFLRDIILNFFEVYNFTVDENSLNDQEVSIDPEMLGKVFENTLAEEERNKKGTFYTPREVVHFMVKDTIRQFLHNETNITLAELQKLIYGEDEKLAFLTPNQIRLIDSKLECIKVLDPAVGSGAFPVEFMQVLIELRKKLNVRVGQNINEVTLKKQLIKNNLYGVDIDPGAIEIAKLRLWLALIVDYDKTLVEPLPNLDFQFRVGNSLQEKIDEIDIFNETSFGQVDWLKTNDLFDQIKSKMIIIKENFYSSNDEIQRHKLKNEFDNLEHKLIQTVLENYKKQLKDQLRNKVFIKTANQVEATLKKINSLEQKIKDGTYKLFKPDFHFSEVFDRINEQGKRMGGFDVVIGNPPYGVAVDNEIKDLHRLDSRDSYGIFISTALNRFTKSGGVLSYIVSDTWLTIKSHKPLREQVLNKQLHKVIRLHKDCFEATVNACIISLTNTPENNSSLIAADLTNISTRKDVEELRNILYHLDVYIGNSTTKYGVYQYNQNLIKTNSNIPIFVASPKLFSLLNSQFYQDKKREIVLIRLDQIADIKYGIRTGNNSRFFFQTRQVRGNYRDITPYKDYIIDERNLEELTEEEKLNGIPLNRFRGKYIVPLNKGGESDTGDNWLPKYYVKSGYYFDWSEKSVSLLKEIKGMRNPHIHFTPGITFSWTGEYAPTFRLSSLGIYDQSSSAILNLKHFDIDQLLGLLNSKLIKYQIKNFIDHTVNSDIEVISSLVIAKNDISAITPYVQKIIFEQRKDPRYNFSDEEAKINEIIYFLYGLTKEEISDVENWYVRRYPLLS